MATHRITHPSRPTIVIVAGLVAIVAVVTVTILTTSSAASGAATARETAGLHALLDDVDPQAIQVFTEYAPTVERSDWCDELVAHHADWDGFRSQIASEADAWATDEVGMLAQVGVAMAATCSDDVADFLASVRSAG